MKYLPLFSLEVVHDYYADQRCDDFNIFPTPETQKLLNNFRCILKSHSGRMEILTLANDKGVPFTQFSADTIFAFHLQLQNPEFSIFTDTTEISKVSSPLFTNKGVNPTLNLGSREAKATENLVVKQPAQNERFILSGKPRPGLQPRSFVVKGLDAVSNPAGYDPVAKTITLNSTSASMRTQFTVTYPVTPQLQRNVFADIEINFKDAQMRKEAGGGKFQVVFRANTVRWKYYVVTDNNLPAPMIEDTDKDKTVIFNIKDRTDLTKTPDLSDAIAQMLAEQHPNKQYFRFVSDSLLPCRQTTRKAIHLQLDRDMVVSALPNPSIQNYTVDLRNSVQEFTLYQIVKYFAH